MTQVLILITHFIPPKLLTGLFLISSDSKLYINVENLQVLRIIFSASFRPTGFQGPKGLQGPKELLRPSEAKGPERSKVLGLCRLYHY